MGLGLAGAISGAGNAMTQGLQTLNSGIVQMGINQSLAKNDREFQMKKLELQQQFEREMQTEKIAADKENSLAQIDATGKNTLALENLRGLNTMAVHQADNQARAEEGDKNRLSNEKVSLYGLKLKAAMHVDEQNALESRFKRELSLKERQLKATQEKPTTIQTDDGRIALMDPQGKSLGYFSDEKGEAIRVASPIPQAERLKIESLMKEAHDLSTVYGKDSFHTPEKEAEYKREISGINKEIDRLLAPYSKKTATPSPVPTKIVIPDKYQNMGPRSATPRDTDTASAQPAVPSGLTQSSGIGGAAKGLVPGLGMIENFLRK